MIEPYDYRSIWINGRFVAISDIVNSSEVGQSSFEISTFSFIREWLSERQTFDIHTSGSTGSPKAILITRQQMIASALLTARVLILEKGQSCLVCIDTKYIGGRMMLVRALTLNLQIYVVDPSANPMEKIPADLCVNFAAFVPYQIENILLQHPNSLNKIGKAIIGGAPLNPETISKLQNFKCAVYATYGMTETVSHVALRKLNGQDMSNSFKTLEGITVTLDERGCLVLSVPYLNEEIVTNDVAELISSTKFRWIGRFDNIINTGGIKVSPEKIEAAISAILSSTGYKNRFFISGVNDRQLGSRVVLVIEANSLDEQFLKYLHARLKAVLSPYEIPKEALLVKNFSETENGKINRLQTVKGFHANVSLK